MKVFFCDNSLVAFTQFRRDVVADFERRGWEVAIVVPRCTVSRQRLAMLNPSWRLFQIDANPNGVNPVGDWKYLRQLRHIYKAERPDMIFHYTVKPNIYGTIAARSLGIKNVAMVAGLGYLFSGNSLKKRIGRMVYRMGLMQAGRVIALNESNVTTLVKGGFVKAKNMILFQGGEGVDLGAYPYTPMDFKTVRFLMVGRVLYDKGYAEFVKAAAIVRENHPEVVFELLGQLAADHPLGVPEPVVDRDVRAAHIKYLGETNDVQSYLRRDGVVMILMSRYMEGLNRSLMEACAMGRPVITTDNPGCREIVDDGVNGFIVPIGNVDALVDAIERFLHLSLSEKQKMARASFEKAKREFSLSGVLEQYQQLTDQTLK